MDCIYKPISKVLAKHLYKVLGKVIGESQHAFLDGRQIMDIVLVANEVVDELVSNKREGIMCKLFMKKAYDHIC